MLSLSVSKASCIVAAANTWLTRLPMQHPSVIFDWCRRGGGEHLWNHVSSESGSWPRDQMHSNSYTNQLHFLWCLCDKWLSWNGHSRTIRPSHHTCKAESDHSDEMELNKDISIEDKISSVSMGGGPKRKMRSHENVTNTGRNEEWSRNVRCSFLWCFEDLISCFSTKERVITTVVNDVNLVWWP